MPCPLLTLPFSKNNKINGAKLLKMLDFFDGFSSLWPGADPGGRMRSMHPPMSHFQKCF